MQFTYENMIVRELILKLFNLMELEMSTIMIMALQFIIVGVALVGMWYLLKGRESFHYSEMKRHH